MVALVTIRINGGTKLAKVEGVRTRDDGVTVWIVRPRFGKRYSREPIEVTADEMLGEPPDLEQASMPQFIADWVIPLLILVAIPGVAFVVQSYVKQKARNLATKQDVRDITRAQEEIRHEFELLRERLRTEGQLRLAVLEKRFQAHQEAYTLWLELRRNIHTPGNIDTVIKCQTVPSVPREVAYFLRDQEFHVDPRKGVVSPRFRGRPVLDRYAVFLMYAYELDIKRGARYWQKLEQAQKLRGYYTHVDVNKPRSISSDEVLSFVEDVLLGIIWPSSLAQRSLLLGMYRLYDVMIFLRESAEPFVERPFFFDWPHIGKEPHLFYCNFEGVDAQKFPSQLPRLSRE